MVRTCPRSSVVTELQGDISDLATKIEEAKGLVDSLRKSASDPVQVKFGIDQGSLAKVTGVANAIGMRPVEVPVKFGVDASGLAAVTAAETAVAASSDRTSGAVRAAAGAAAVWWGLTAAQIHLAVAALIDTAAVAIPAGAALGAFAAGAEPTVQQLYYRLSDINTIVMATGQNMAPMTGGLAKVQEAMQNPTLQLYGAGLQIVNDRQGEFAKLAQEGGSVLDQFAAKAVIAMDNSGSSINKFLAHAGTDLQEIIQTFANLGGAIAHLAADAPGVADLLLRLVQGFTGMLDAVSRLPAPLLATGMALHAAMVYVPAFAGGLTSIVQGLNRMTGGAAEVDKSATGLGGSFKNLGTAVSGLGSNLTTAGLGIAAWGEKGVVAAKGAEDAGVATKLWAGASALLTDVPVWGWVAAGAVALGGLAYWLSTVKDDTQKWTDSLQSAVSNANVYTIVATSASAYNQVTQQLTQAQSQLAKAQAESNGQTGAASRFTEGVSGAYTALQQKVQDLTAAQRQFAAENQRLNQAQVDLEAKFGLTASGVAAMTVQMTGSQQAADKLWQQLAKGQITLQQFEQEFTNYAAATSSFAAGTAGQRADLYVLMQQTQDATVAVNKLNQAWDTFIGLSTGLQNAFTSSITNARQLAADATKTGASFNGVNAQSITLQQDFSNNLIPTLLKTMDGMKQAGSSSTDMASVLSTILKPAVDAGALANKGMEAQIYAMAVRAGYTGPNQIASLTAWIYKMNTGFQNAANTINGQTVPALNSLPAQKNSQVYVQGSGSFSIQAASGNVAGTHYAYGAHAAGGHIRGPGSGTSDSIPTWLSNGEFVVNAASTARHLGLLHAINAGKMASGGTVSASASGVTGSYDSGRLNILGSLSALGAMGPWANDQSNANPHSAYPGVTYAISAAIAQAIKQMEQQMMSGIGMAGISNAGAYAALMSAAAKVGWTGGLWQDLVSLEMREAGFNLGIVNSSSGAAGIAQFIQGFGEYYQYGGNPYSAAGQAVAMVNYIIQRYGNPANAWAHEVNYGWYDRGGFLKPGLNIAMNGTGRDEPVGAAIGGGQDITIHNVIQLDGKTLYEGLQPHALRHAMRNGGRNGMTLSRR